MRTIMFAALLAGACGAPASEEKQEAVPVAYEGAIVQQAAARVAHGSRLADVLGCRGCHGESLQGENFTKDMPQYAPLWASNLTRAVPQYSDAQLERLFRHGEHPVRGELWAMPSEMFRHLSAPDMAALIAYLRSLQPAGEPSPPPNFNELDRKEIAAGEFKPTGRIIAESANQAPVDLGPQHELGRYIAMTACTECHGHRLEGQRKNPDLIVASAYDRQQFEKLMTTGIPLDGRKLRLMDGVARGRTAKMTKHERDALYAYLKARAEQPQ